jgi:hypothetical protein
MDLNNVNPEVSKNPDMYFRLLSSSSGPRLGRLALNKVTIDTPSFIAPASRGAVPHLSHDNLRDHTDIKGIYVALEDCTCLLHLPSLLTILANFKPKQLSKSTLLMSQSTIKPQEASETSHPHLQSPFLFSLADVCPLSPPPPRTQIIPWQS